MGGLRYEDVRNLLEGYQRQVVAKIVEKVAASAVCVPAETVTEDGYDPCLECLRWGECNGVDEVCPWK